MKKYLALLLIAATVATAITSCKKDDHGDPPVLPTSKSMDIDFENFESSAKGGQEISIPKGVSTDNWGFAAGVAIVWKTIIYSTFAVPVKAFALAVNSNPSYINDNTWEWNYDATITIDNASVTYKARLTGEKTDSNVIWKMYISKEGTAPFSEFVWFEGTSSLDGTSGQWILNESYQNQVPVLQIDWTSSNGKVNMVKHTYVRAGSTFKESYIEYGLTSETLNAYYKIHYYNSTNMTFFDLDVKWSTTGKNGQVYCPLHFGNTDWYCWDSNYINVSCN